MPYPTLHLETHHLYPLNLLLVLLQLLLRGCRGCDCRVPFATSTDEEASGKLL